MSTGGAITAAAAVNGWKLLLLALLGGYVVSKTGDALGSVIHGSPSLVSVKTGPISAGPDAPTSPPKVAGVSGIDPLELDDLAAVFADTYGPLPPEVIAGLPGASSELQVAGHPAAWAAGLVAAAAAVAVIAWRMHPGGLPAVAAHVDPVEVKPIQVSPIAVKPELPDLAPLGQQAQQLLGGKGGGAPAGLPPQAGALAQQLSGFLKNAGG